MLVVSVTPADRDYALIQVFPHATQPRGARFEVGLAVRFLDTGAFNIQGMLAVPSAKLLRRLGKLTAVQMGDIEAIIKQWLDLAG